MEKQIAINRYLPNKKSSDLLETRGFFYLESAVRTGLEPVTPCVTGMYSNQLN